MSGQPLKKPKKPVAKKAIGRPSSFTQAIADAICERISNGESLKSICAIKSMPSVVTVMAWLNNNAEFLDQYARAREVQAENMLDEIVAIADDSTLDTIIDEDGNERVNHEVVARSRLRVDARKWVMAKLAPKKYGEKVDVNHGNQPDNPLLMLVQRVSGTALPLAAEVDGEIVDGD